jgi:ribosomal protein S18 acetylase RimI-like enzyme
MVRLDPLTTAEFGPFFSGLLEGYAADHVRTGHWTQEEAPERARDEVQKLLPDGLGTPNHLFFSIRAEPSDEKVGVIWLAIEPRGAFVYDLLVFEPHRRKGYAESAMREAERVSRERGAERITLHVFGDNAGARKLYQKLGYTETNVLMSKPLSP